MNSDTSPWHIWFGGELEMAKAFSLQISGMFFLRVCVINLDSSAGSEFGGGGVGGDERKKGAL